MRVVALVSGGKDSCYNMMQCVAAGHEIVALANLQPSVNEEIDSYMYQTVGHDGISVYSEAMGLPLYRRIIYGNAVVQDKEYSPTQGDEVEDLFVLLSDIKKEISFDAIAVGAILSDYQRIRVENVCMRLGCVSLAYLWRRDQSELLQEMIDCGINAIIIKTASLGLDPDEHLGKSIADMQAHLLSSKEKYGINVCGEGGEYETFTLDCALFQHAIVLDEYEKVIHSNDAFAPVGYLKLNKMHLVKKTAKVTETTEVEIDATSRPTSQKDQLNGYPVKSPLDYLADLIECNKADCCDGHFEFCEKGNPSGGEGIDNKGLECCTVICSKSGTNIQGDGDLETDLSIADVPIPEVSLSDAVIEEQLSTEPVEPQVEISRPCQNHNVRETLSFPVTLRVTTNAGGWLWAMGIQGTEDMYSGSNNAVSNNPMRNALAYLQRILEERGLHLTDLIGVVMYVSNMEDYAIYNGEYNKFFASRPPVRICVEAPLPLDTPIVLEGLAFLPPFEGEGNTRQCMHVQGISHWAPANIGPYSQAIWVGDIIYVAGQIGLIPGSMKLVEGGAKMECKLALRHINRVIKATDSKVELRDVVQGICYVTDCKFIEECRHEWEKRTNNAIVEYLVVPRLPRDAHVEWQIWAHKHNTAFEYEETGCYVGSGVKVRIIRRWNYENRVAAIVCRASISSDKVGTANLGKEELLEMTEYALNKLLREADKSIELIDKSCSLRVFYRIGAVNPVDIVQSLESQSLKYSVAFSVLPVCSLVQENTLLSFCGVRHH